MGGDIRPLLFFFLFLAISIQEISAQVTAIPDPNFEQTLIDLGIDSDSTLNGEVATDDINFIRDLDVSGYRIKDLTGIQDFDSLESLNCARNLLENLDISSNKLLTTLNTPGNQLTSLDVSSNTLLENLNFTNNRIENIDITGLDSLMSLRCSNNRLTSLNLTNNQQLKELFCDTNQLTNLNLTQNQQLTALVVGSNQLSTLNLTQNDSLTLVNASDNQLASLDVSQNLILENLTVSANQLAVLVLNQNDSLSQLDCSRNNLKLLDLSSNQKLESLSCASNQLTSIEVDSNLYLRSLDFSFNLVQTINLTDHDSLTYLDVSNNQLEYLNISNGFNSELGFFSAQHNPGLTCIQVDDANQTGDSWFKDSQADYSNSCDPILTYIPDNSFEQVLIDRGLDSGSIDSLVVSDSIKYIISLDISGLGIMDLTGIEDFENLAALNCSDNQLASLDFTANKMLTDLNCSNNQLTVLSIKNGHNDILITFNTQNNPGLTCIAVDDQTQTGSGWMKDAAASYADNCNTGQTFIPDDNFELALITMGLDSGTLDNYIVTDSISGLETLDLSGQNIFDLTGIEDFQSLDTLDCSENNLTFLNVSQNLSLKSLTAFGNYLSDLDITSNDSLLSLNVGSNLFTSLDVGQNTDLTELIFDANNLNSIDISSNTALVRLNGNSNRLTNQGLDLSSAPQLRQLFAANNNLTDIDLTNNSGLRKIDVSNNYLTDLDLQDNDSLEVLECSVNQLSVLNVSNNLKLDTLKANSNQFTNLSFATNILLRYLAVEDNLVADLEISTNIALGALLVSSNQLASLDLAQNAVLNLLHCDNNQFETLDVTNNPLLLDLSGADNQLEVLDLSQNIELLRLNVDGNLLDTLDLSSNLLLQSLSISRNQFDSINTSINAALVSLDVDDNNISELDLQANIQLENLSANSNNLTNLDLSLHPELRAVNVSSNQLITLVVKNGNNQNLSTLNASNNPDLGCIEIDDLDNIQDSWQKDETTSYQVNCHYEDTYIPDDNFESMVASIAGVPDDNDDYIPTSAITEILVLDVSSSDIADLTGIEDFTALEELNISNNSIVELNLDENADLLKLYVSGNNLDTLILDNGQLQVLDVSSNQLIFLSTDSLPSLAELMAGNNKLTELDVRNNGALEILNCSSNKLAVLKADNGNNVNLQTFDATVNPDLTCIQVDDPDNIGSGWSKDAQAAYSANCHFNETYVPDDAFEQALIDQGLDYSRMEIPDDYIPTDKIRNLISLSISNRGIVDLTGLEAFDSLTSLNCRNNGITNPDIIYGLNLASLDCSDNQLTEFDFTSTPALRTLNISNNLLTSVDISVNPELTSLNFSKNQLTVLDIAQNPKLEWLNASSNRLFAIDANSGYNDSLRTFVVTDNPDLRCILVDDIQAAQSRSGWHKDASAEYRLECDDDDNDGVADNDDLCPGTPFGSQVDLFGCTVFRLPADNFNIRTTGETCSTADNGKIKIVAKQSILYTATLSGGFETKVHQFTDTLEVRNLKAGNYQLCLTIEEHPDYKQCYELLITEPEDLIIKSGGIIGGRISYEMSGGDSYIVSFNGLIFETEQDRITLTLDDGLNHISIKTKAECQGIFEERLLLSDQARIFPNPFSNQLKLYIGDFDREQVSIHIFSISGKTLFSGRVPVHYGQAVINTADFPEGIYSIGLTDDGGQTILKGIKK